MNRLIIKNYSFIGDQIPKIHLFSDLTVKRDPYKNPFNRLTPTQAKVENEDHKNNQNLYVPPPSRKDEKNKGKIPPSQLCNVSKTRPEKN